MLSTVKKYRKDTHETNLSGSLLGNGATGGRGHSHRGGNKALMYYFLGKIRFLKLWLYYLF